ncbi:MAG: hypothetical protein CSA62_11655 [Planctomycetota bacterium]|nr:MAG: hypothetical protein CSA62_11655 [Planctomycetota bacterium]
MRLTSIAVALTCTVSLLAQNKPCASLNDNNSNVSTAITQRSFTGPNTWAWRYVSPKPQAALGLRIFTKNRYFSGFMTLEIWSENSSSQLPGKMLQSGTWRFERENIAKWQGARFSGSVLLRPKQAYWFVWREPGFSTMPTEPSGVTMTKAVVRSGSSWRPARSTALKWRLFCSPLNTVGTQAYGSSCAGSNKRFPALFNNEAPKLGNASFRLEASGLPSGAAVIWILGAQPLFKSILLPGTARCWLNTDIAVLIPGIAGTGNVQARSAAGHCYLPLPIRNSPPLRGLYLGAQVTAIDKGMTTSLPMVFTNGMRCTVQ